LLAMTMLRNCPSTSPTTFLWPLLHRAGRVCGRCGGHRHGMDRRLKADDDAGVDRDAGSSPVYGGGVAALAATEGAPVAPASGDMRPVCSRPGNRAYPGMILAR
jgi:hypothetical protein